MHKRDGVAVLECDRCPELCESRQSIVNGRGSQHPKIAFVGLGPGREEDRRAEAWIGPAGQTARNWLIAAGFDPKKDVYYTNATRCIGPKNNEGKEREPTAEEVRNCRSFLMDELEYVAPDLIVPAGGIALETLYNEAKFVGGKPLPITRLRGAVLWQEELGKKMVPILHPASAFHVWSNERYGVADLQKALKESKQPDVFEEGLGKYQVCLDVESVESLADLVETEAGVLSIDTETTSLDWQTGKVLCVGVSWQPGTAYVVPVLGLGAEEMWSAADRKRVIVALRRIFESGVPKIAQNGRFDELFLKHDLEIYLKNFTFDTMLCVGAKAPVALAGGKTKRIRDIVRDKDPGPVMSLNLKTGKLEPKRVVGWHRSPVGGRAWSRLSYRGAHGEEYRGHLWVTSDHEILTISGWKPVDQAKGVMAMTAEPSPTAIQHQIIVGDLLGDGCISRSGKRWRYGFSHASRSRDFAQLKARSLWNFNCRLYEKKPTDGQYRGNFRSGPQVTGASSGFSVWAEYRSRFYPEGKKIVPNDLSAREMGDLAMAVWYMGDGSLTGQRKYVPKSNRKSSGRRHGALFCTQGFDMKSREILIALLAVRGYEATIRADGSIALPVDSAARMFGAIGRYMPESFRYKLPPDSPAFDEDAWFDDDESRWCAPYEVSDGGGPMVGAHGRRHADRWAYCIDVEDNHNFVANNIVLHNCYHLFHEEQGHSLDTLCNLYTNMGDYSREANPYKDHMADCPLDVLWKYQGADADCTLRVALTLDAMLDKAPERRWIFENITMPLSEATMHMEERGVLVDQQKADKLVETYDNLVAEQRALLCAIPEVPENFNHRSDKQKRKLLFGKRNDGGLELEPSGILTEKGRESSVKKAALEEIGVHSHPVIPILIRLAGLETIMKTFLKGASPEAREKSKKGLLNKISEIDGRLHTNYRVDGTETGRLSASPNIQNIVGEGKSEEGAPIREIFIAPLGRVLLSADYSQIELRGLAYISGDERLIGVLESGVDVHDFVARRLFDVEEGVRVTKEQRRQAKCMTPETRILMKDLSWRQLANVRAGDEIMAFDEEVPKDARARRMRPSRVVDAHPDEKELFEIKLQDGTVLRVTEDHPFLTRRRVDGRKANFAWRTISSGLKRVLRVLPVWDEVDSKDAGWLAGMFDGEGSVGVLKNHGCYNIAVAQRPGPTMDRVERLVEEFGFDYSRRTRRYRSRFPDGTEYQNACDILTINGGLGERLRFLGSIRPERLIERVAEQSSVCELRGEDVEIFLVTPIGRGPVISLETESATFIAEGIAVHNTFNFGLGYGMTEQTLSKRLGVSKERAAELLDMYFGIVEKLPDYFAQQRRTVRNRHEVYNIFGRRRLFWGVETMRHFGGYKRQMGHVYRESYNFPVQSSASDIHSLATIRLDRDKYLRENEAWIVFSVHDSVMMEVAIEKAEEVARYVQKLMQDTAYEETARVGRPWVVPVDIEWGPAWENVSHHLSQGEQVHKGAPDKCRRCEESVA